MVIVEMIPAYLTALEDCLHSLNPNAIVQFAKKLEMVRTLRNSVYVVGNGGSQANASHFVLHLRDAGFRAFELLCDSAWLSATSNDSDYDVAAVMLLDIIERTGDCLVVISGSGKSVNILACLHGFKGLKLGILGSDGGHAKSLCDYTIDVPELSYGPVEDTHSAVIHILSEMLK